MKRKLTMYTIKNKKELRKRFGKYPKIPKSLYGHCSYADGVYFFQWEQKASDYCISIEDSTITQKELKFYKKLARKNHKRLYVSLHTHDRGFGTVFLKFLIGKVADKLLDELIDYCIARIPNYDISSIEITKNNEKNECTLKTKGDIGGEIDSLCEITLEKVSEKQIDYFINNFSNKIDSKVIYYDKDGNLIYEQTKNQKIDILA